MPTLDGNVTRCDVRVPNELYERIEALAVQKGARIHHRSGKPEVTGTILELLKIGLKYQNLSDKIPDKESEDLNRLFPFHDNSDSRISGYLTVQERQIALAVQELHDRIDDLPDRLSDKLPAQMVTEESFEAAIATLQSEIDEIKKALSLRDRSTLRQQIQDEDEFLGGITKASLEPIFEASEKGLGNKELSEIIGVPTSTLEKWKVKIKRHPDYSPPSYDSLTKEWKLGGDGRWYPLQLS